MNKRDQRGGGGEELSTLKRGEYDGFTKKTPLYITRLAMFVFLEGLMLHVACNPVLRCSKQRVKSFINRYCRYNHVDTINSDSANFKKGIHIAKYKGGDVVMQCHRH